MAEYSISILVRKSILRALIEAQHRAKSVKAKEVTDAFLFTFHLLSVATLKFWCQNCLFLFFSANLVVNPMNNKYFSLYAMGTLSVIIHFEFSKLEFNEILWRFPRNKQKSVCDLSGFNLLTPIFSISVVLLS